MSRTVNVAFVATCHECGKRCYPNRRAAVRAAKTQHPDDRMRAYRCGAYWHYGHLNERYRLMADSVAVACPDCAARRAMPCIGPAGEELPWNLTHPARIQEYRDAQARVVLIAG